MLFMLSLIACGGDSVELAGPREALSGPSSVMAIGKPMVKLAADVEGLELQRVDFPVVEGLKVRTGCAVGLDGVRVGAILDEEACAETPEVFAKRTSDEAAWKLVAGAEGVLSKLADMADDDLSGDAAALLDAMAIESTVDSAGARMALAARARAAGVKADLWGCVGEYTRTRASQKRAVIDAQCSIASADPSDARLAGLLGDLGERRTQAAEIDKAMTRTKDAWTAAKHCVDVTAKTVADVPANESITGKGRSILVVPAIAGETLTVEVTSDIGTPSVTVYDAGCDNRYADEDGNSGRYAWGYRFGMAAPAGPRSTKVQFRAPKAGHYVVFATVASDADAMMAEVEGVAPEPQPSELRYAVTTNGEGGPSEEERKAATDYMKWFDTAFPGVTAQEIAADRDVAFKKVGEGRKQLESVLRGRTDGAQCAVKAVIADELLVASFVDEALKACEGEITAAIDARIAVSKD